VQFSLNVFIRIATFLLLTTAGLLTACSGDNHSGNDKIKASVIKEVFASQQDADSLQADPDHVTREGVIVEMNTLPVNKDVDKVMASDWADVSFRITDAATGEPITGRYPAAWMDLAKAWEAKGDKPMSCTDRVQTYLQGIVGVRPMIDLNSHFLLVMNADASISVIDPVVGITGITNLFAQINIEHPGADWAKTEDQKQLYIAMPLANMVAWVDTDSFKVVMNIDAGESPTRVELQSDERYLWVGNNATRAEQSGITIIDVVEKKPVTFIATGEGHHEIAFSENDRYAFVSNRNSGTVSVIDVQTRQKIKDIETGKMPLSLAYSTLSKALYVADGRNGEITVIDGVSFEIRTRLTAKPGLGPMRFAEGGRWGMVVNPSENLVFVLDTSKDELVHTVSVGKQPYQVTFTRSFAYIRSLATEDVGLIPLSELDESMAPPVTYIVAGTQPPGAAAKISIADSIIPSVKEAATYIVNQADGTVHYYMEGMVAPMGAFRNYGHQARAIEIVDRSLSEREPGVYSGRVKLPVEGEYDIAFMMDTPRFLHCFSTKVVPNPEVKSTAAKLSVDFLSTERYLPVHTDIPFRIKLTDPRTGQALNNISDVTVLYYRSDGRDRRVVPAKPMQDGVYEATIKLDSTSAYYVFVGSSSSEVSYSELPFFSIKGMPAPAPKQEPEKTAGGNT